ncbi:hypothetical protein GQ42DRAFT_177557 [Ramicandelaber brevisporus]|nr:hypothetical protein GQ42DRAFT_177557 [Ramicandelaber brevisporus]
MYSATQTGTAPSLQALQLLANNSNSNNSNNSNSNNNNNNNNNKYQQHQPQPQRQPSSTLDRILANSALSTSPTTTSFLGSGLPTTMASTTAAFFSSGSIPAQVATSSTGSVPEPVVSIPQSTQPILGAAAPVKPELASLAAAGVGSAGCPVPQMNRVSDWSLNVNVNQTIRIADLQGSAASSSSQGKAGASESLQFFDSLSPTTSLCSLGSCMSPTSSSPLRPDFGLNPATTAAATATATSTATAAAIAAAASVAGTSTSSFIPSFDMGTPFSFNLASTALSEPAPNVSAASISKQSLTKSAVASSSKSRNGKSGSRKSGAGAGGSGAISATASSNKPQPHVGIPSSSAFNSQDLTPEMSKRLRAAMRKRERTASLTKEEREERNAKRRIGNLAPEKADKIRKQKRQWYDNKRHKEGKPVFGNILADGSMEDVEADDSGVGSAIALTSTVPTRVDIPVASPLAVTKKLAVPASRRTATKRATSMTGMTSKTIAGLGISASASAFADSTGSSAAGGGVIPLMPAVAPTGSATGTAHIPFTLAPTTALTGSVPLAHSRQVSNVISVNRQHHQQLLSSPVDVGIDPRSVLQPARPANIVTSASLLGNISYPSPSAMSALPALSTPTASTFTAHLMYNSSNNSSNSGGVNNSTLLPNSYPSLSLDLLSASANNVHVNAMTMSPMSSPSATLALGFPINLAGSSATPRQVPPQPQPQPQPQFSSFFGSSFSSMQQFLPPNNGLNATDIKPQLQYYQQQHQQQQLSTPITSGFGVQTANWP